MNYYEYKRTTIRVYRPLLPFQCHCCDELSPFAWIFFGVELCSYSQLGLGQFCKGRQEGLAHSADVSRVFGPSLPPLALPIHQIYQSGRRPYRSPSYPLQAYDYSRTLPGGGGQLQNSLYRCMRWGFRSLPIAAHGKKTITIQTYTEDHLLVHEYIVQYINK